MKKLVILISIMTIFVTGCSVTTLKSNNIEENVKNILSKNIELSNIQYDGYSYYVPRGLKFIARDKYNALFRDEYGVDYYMYVDIISKYNKNDLEHEINEDIYYSENYNYYGKKGFLDIIKNDDMYLIKFVFNYVKIEAYVNKKYLDNTIVNSANILRSIKYNDVILHSLVGNNKYNKKDESYNLFNNKTKVDDFLLKVSKYDEKYRKRKDVETIVIEDIK